VGIVLAAFSPGQIILGLPAIRNPLGIEGLPNAYKPVQALMLILIAVSVASLLQYKGRAQGGDPKSAATTESNTLLLNVVNVHRSVFKAYPLGRAAMCLEKSLEGTIIAWRGMGDSRVASLIVRRSGQASLAT
jgi:hypothetical protein